MTTAYHVQRPALRRNSPIRRASPPLSMFDMSNGFAANAPMMQRFDVGDSSDDEMPQPMKFSALTTALLESDGKAALLSPRQSREIRAETQSEGHDTPVRQPVVKVIRKPSPYSRQISTASQASTASPRLLGITRDVTSTEKPAVGSTSSFPLRTASRQASIASQYVTPAPSRTLRVARARADVSFSEIHDEQSQMESQPQSGNGDRDDENHIGIYDAQRSGSSASATGTATRQTTMTRATTMTTDTTVAPGTSRLKRFPMATGAFLRSAPVRRGFRSRHSEDHPSPDEEHYRPLAAHDQQDEEKEDSEGGPAPSDQPRYPYSRTSSRADVHVAQDQDLEPSHRPPARKISNEHLARRDSIELYQKRVDSAQSNNVVHTRRMNHKVYSDRTKDGVDESAASTRPSVSFSQNGYAASASRVRDTTSDQENMPPPTFKRNKDSDFKVLGMQRPGVLSAKVLTAETPVPVPSHQQSSPRRALGSLSANTPQRPAPPPPPPKMTVLDTATKTAGASATKSKKRRAHVMINGKLFTQLGKLGKGGSSEVFSVMAENQRLFALKKVKLADCDEAAVRGYKGEIDLLKSLKDVDRVVRLYDYELDKERDMLLVLMEKGEGDLNRVLSGAIAHSTTEAKLDTVFVRYWWREMLECVSAVHARHIVHSDLKPANFLLVDGRLKLIDFGIANTIDTDVTMNVHRDTHVGTPNYMSPESITDTNAPTPSSSSSSTSNNLSSSSARIMKLGKPSDVWSLGCILYQLTYSRPPFAHIPNQLSRVMAITNPSHTIEFPPRGTGGVHVPPALRATLVKCLQRDPALRPTVEDLLSEADPWMYPDSEGKVGMGEEVLGAIIQRVVDRVLTMKKKSASASDAGAVEGKEGGGLMVGGQAECRVWAKGFLDRIVGLAAEGGGGGGGS